MLAEIWGHLTLAAVPSTRQVNHAICVYVRVCGPTSTRYITVAPLKTMESSDSEMINSMTYSEVGTNSESFLNKWTARPAKNFSRSILHCSLKSIDIEQRHAEQLNEPRKFLSDFRGSCYNTELYSNLEGILIMLLRYRYCVCRCRLNNFFRSSLLHCFCFIKTWKR